MGDPLGFIPDISSTSMMVPQSVPQVSNSSWFSLLHTLFPGEEVLQNEGNRVNWNPIVNSGIEKTDKTHNSLGIGRYMSTNRFMTEVLEESRNTNIAYKRAHLDVWIGFLASFLGLDNAKPRGDMDEYEHLFLPVTGGRLLLTGSMCVVQIGHNDFFVRHPDQLSGVFVIITGPSGVSLWVTDHSHKLVYYPDDIKKELIERLHMKRIDIPANSVFFGHGYLHHAGDKYRGSNCLRYHTYLRPASVELPNAVMFNHGGGHGPKYNDDGTLETGLPTPQPATLGASSSNNNNGTEHDFPLATSPNRKKIVNNESGMELDDDQDDSDQEGEPDNEQEVEVEDTIVPEEVPDFQ